MKHALLALSLVSCSPAHAEELPSEFFYDYQGVEIVLTPDVCDKSDASAGWIAYGKQGDKVANGCWHHKNDLTIELWLSPEPKIFYEYVFYKDKFQPRYDK